MVLENEKFVGESLMNKMIANEERVISFAVESNIEVTWEIASVLISPPSAVEFKYITNPDPSIEFSFTKTVSVCYTIQNKIEKEFETFYLDHRFTGEYMGYDVVPDKIVKHEVKPGSIFRFILKVPANETVKFKVQGTRECTTTKNISCLKPGYNDYNEAIHNKWLSEDTLAQIVKLQSRRDILVALSDLESNTDNVALDTVHCYKKFKYINDDVVKVMSSLIENQAHKNQFNAQILNYEKEVNEIFKNHARLRENLKSLKNIQEDSLKKRYLREFEVEEDKLKTTRGKIQKCNEDKDKCAELRIKLIGQLSDLLKKRREDFN